MSSAARFRRHTQTVRGAVMDLHKAFCVLRHLGWAEPIYITEEIDEIEVIELGSCGIFRANRIRHADGSSMWFATDGEEQYPCRILLWRRVPVPIEKGARHHRTPT